MRRAILAISAAFAFLCSGCFTQGALADGMRVVHSKVARQACRGPHCGPYAPCGVRCRVVCPDGYSCAPLYGAYGPYGGEGFWGAYTFSGWGYR
jgi:hypothetical protein